MNAQNMTDFQQKLAEAVYQKLIAIRNDEQDRYIIDRVFTPGFLNIFRESLYEYSIDTILVERFFKPEFCVQKTLEFPVLTAEGKEIQAQMQELLKTLEQQDLDQLSNQELEEIKQKLNEYQDKLTSPECLTKEPVETMFYVNEEMQYDFPLINIKSLTETELRSKAELIANFALIYLINHVYYAPTALDSIEIGFFPSQNSQFEDLILKYVFR